MKPLEQWKHEPTYRLGASIKVTAKDGAKKRGQEYHRRIYSRLGSLLAVQHDVRLLVEPWYRCLSRPAMRQPDSVIMLPEANVAVVCEVKLNWKDGRDLKLLREYLPIVACAHKLDMVWPLMITHCLRGYPHPPLLGLKKWEEAMAWMPGKPTPLMLVP